jgi:hypothetical protein
MLESLFAPSIVRKLRHETTFLEKDLHILKKLYAYLEKEKAIVMGILHFAVKGPEVKELFTKLKQIDHLLVHEEEREERVEVRAIHELQELIGSGSTQGYTQILEELIQLMQAQQRIFTRLFALDAKLQKKKYKQASATRLAKEIRGCVQEQIALLKKHETLIHLLLGKVTQEKEKLKQLLTRTYGRAVGERAAVRILNSNLLTSGSELNNCFIMTSRLEKLIAQLHTKRGRDSFKVFFKKIGVKAQQQLIVFKITALPEGTVLAELPPPQPQRSGIVEQKLPQGTKINVLSVHKL